MFQIMTMFCNTEPFLHIYFDFSSRTIAWTVAIVQLLAIVRC